MSALLQVKNLRVSFDAGGAQIWRRKSIHGVADVSFKIAAGETYAIVGESGCGKTTLLRAIAGLFPASGGSVKFMDKEIIGISPAEYRPLRKEIAVMFQDPVGSLSPRCTVQSLLAEPYIINRMHDVDLRHEVERLLDMVGLHSKLSARYPHELSGGQARRVGVARALALSPKLILADEPTAGLDVSVQGELLNLLNELQEKLGLAMMLITHNLNVIRHVADRMGIMYLGRLVEEGDTQSIFSHSRHPYTRCLLSANSSSEMDASGQRIALHGEPPGIATRPHGCEFRQRCPFADEKLCAQTPTWLTDDQQHGVRCLKPLTAIEKL